MNQLVHSVRIITFPIALLLLLFFSSCKEDDPQPVNNIEQAFEQLWGDFDEFYPYFELKGIDWDSIYSANKSLIDEGTNSSDLKDLLANMTLSLRDLHVRFIASGTTYQYRKRQNYPANLPDNASNYLSNVVFNNNRVLFASVENTNVAYVRVKTLSGNPDDYTEFSGIMSDLPSRDALIVDLRENGGGSDAVGRAFASRLTDEARVYERVRYRNGPEHDDFGDWIDATLSPQNPIDFQHPVVVLTNRGCYSSAESFVLMLKALPNAILVGDTTGGATGNPKEFTLYNGWKYYVSTWQSVDPDYQLIEDHGIAPDVAVNNTQESVGQGKDLMLEKALELLE